MEMSEQVNVFAVVSSLQKLKPLTKDKIESLLGARLSLHDENEYVRFWRSPVVKLKDGSTLEGIDFRSSKDNADDGGYIRFHLRGRCVLLETLRDLYPGLVLTDVPRGRTADEETTYLATVDGVRIGLGFKESDPDCLYTVVVEPLA